MYDVNTNGIHEISKSLYCFISDNSECDYSVLLDKAETKLKNELEFLYDQGCLSNNRPKIIEHSATGYLSSLTSQYVSNLLLQVTKNCNFKCRYCAFAGDTNLERSHTDQSMDWEVAKKAIDFLYEKGTLSKKISISFYGGEPLLNFRLIKQAVEYADKKFAGRRLRYAMTTNLSILTDEMIEIIRTHDFFVTVSLDGSAYLHNKNRRFLKNGAETHEMVVKNLRKLREKVGDYTNKISINTVVDPEENYNEYLEYYKNNSLFDDIKVEFSTIDTSRLRYDLRINQKFKVESDIYKLRHYLSLIGNDQYKPDLINEADNSLLGSYYYFMPKSRLGDKEHHRGPCVPGIRKLFVTTDGHFLPCEKVSEESNCMIIGDVENGFDYANIYRLLNIGKLTETECLSCICIRHCSICARDIDNIYNLDVDFKREICSQRKKLLKSKIEKHIIFNELGLFNVIK